MTSRAKSAPKETTLRTGERVLLRAIGPADKQALVHGLHRMSPKSRYRRFFSPVEELGASQLRYLTEVNHHTHEALIAINPNTGDPVGVARFIRSGDDSSLTLQRLPSAPRRRSCPRQWIA